MRQFEFELINKKTGRVEHARATAKNAHIARLQIVLMYEPQFDVAGLCCAVNPPHHVLGEIDCSGFPEHDTLWLEREASIIEGIQYA